MEYLMQAVALPELGLKKAGALGLTFLRHIKDHFIPHARNNYHPHLLGDRSLALFSTFLVAVKIFTIVLISFGPVLPAFSEAITAQNIISLTNNSRMEYGLSALTENSMLDKAAQTKANDMLAKGYFSHTTPDGHTPWYFINNAGYNYLMAGENLAVNFWEAENVEQAWMNSPGHKANILNKNFEEIGIGISQGEYQGHNAIFVVQMFGVPMDQKVAMSSGATPVQKTDVPVPATVSAAPTGHLSSQVRGAQDQSGSGAVQNPVVISSANVKLEGAEIQISAQVSGGAVKVLAYFGDKAVMLAPKSDGSWIGQVGLSELAAGNLTVQVKAFDITGQIANYQLADFSNSTVANYNIISSDTRDVQVSWWGRVFSPKTLEQKIYLFFIAGILSCLVLAIGIKRHIQHLNLIANSSFVVVLACLLWMAG